MNCFDCELYGPCNGRHGCAKNETPLPLDDPYTVSDALVDLGITLALLLAVGTLAFNIGYWLH